MKKEWLNPRIMLRYGEEVVQFKEIVSDDAEGFVQMVKEKFK